MSVLYPFVIEGYGSHITSPLVMHSFLPGKALPFTLKCLVKTRQKDKKHFYRVIPDSLRNKTACQEAGTDRCIPYPDDLNNYVIP